METTNLQDNRVHQIPISILAFLSFCNLSRQLAHNLHGKVEKRGDDKLLQNYQRFFHISVPEFKVNNNSMLHIKAIYTIQRYVHVLNFSNQISLNSTP